MQISNNYKGQDSRDFLESLGFQVLDTSDNGYDQAMSNLGIRLHKIAYSVVLPEGWVVEDQGPFHTFLNGPDGKQLRSFIKRDPWDRHSFLEAE